MDERSHPGPFITRFHHNKFRYPGRNRTCRVVLDCGKVLVHIRFRADPIDQSPSFFDYFYCLFAKRIRTWLSLSVFAFCKTSVPSGGNFESATENLFRKKKTLTHSSKQLWYQR